MGFEGLVFRDCMVVGLSRDATRDTLTLTFESYDANIPASEPDLYALECSGLKDVKLQFSSESLDDLNRPYDPQGDDQRANEIHTLYRDKSGNVHIQADMIQGSFYCQECRLHRVVDGEVGG